MEAMPTPSPEQYDYLWYTVAIVTNAVGSGMALYGFRQKAPLPLVGGVALCVLPALLPTGAGALAITVLICVAYYFVRKLV